MRILYIDVNLIYINSTGNLLKNILMQFAEVDFYGPGFVSNIILEKGIKSFLENKSYNLIVFGNHVSFLSEIEPKSFDNFYKNFVYLFCKVESIYSFQKDIFYSIQEINIPKVASFLAYDYYAATQNDIDKLAELDIFILGPGKEFVKKIDELPGYVKEEKHYKIKKNRISDAWYIFSNKSHDKFISMTHFISDTEFYFNPLMEREFDVSVPGVEYHLRKNVIDSLNKTKYTMPSKHYMRIFAILNKLKVNTYSTFIGNKFYNLQFQKNLFNTKLIYTAKGGFGIPLRKFFEIPASGALMLATPCNGFSNLGFIDKVNFINCDPNNVIDSINYYMLNLEEAQNISLNGRKLIYKKHSLNARATQLEKAFIHILEKTFNGSYWEDGKFIIKKKDNSICVV